MNNIISVNYIIEKWISHFIPGISRIIISYVNEYVLLNSIDINKLDWKGLSV